MLAGWLDLKCGTGFGEDDDGYQSFWVTRRTCSFKAVGSSNLDRISGFRAFLGDKLGFSEGTGQIFNYSM